MKIPNLKKMITRADGATPVVVPKKVVVKKAPVKKVAVPKVAKTATSAPKKVAVKKAVAKKSSPAKKATPVHRLVVASDSESFWTTDGKVLNSLPALAVALKSMTTSVYAYHLSESGSDFADWVETVLSAPECATALRKAKTAKSAHSAVVSYLKQYKL